MSARERLTPHTFAYEEKVINDGREVNWAPYSIFFQPENHVSDVVNTDAHGFRYSERHGSRYSVGDHPGIDACRLLVGSSTVFGIGATSDRRTLSSCLSEHDVRPAPWFNFGALAFNSAQELMLGVLNRHLLPRVEEIVLFTGFNNLVLARLPAGERFRHGQFFNSERYSETTGTRVPAAAGTGLLSRFKKPVDDAPEAKPSLEVQLERAAGLTLRHLEGWRALARDLGARLTLVLQPVALWVRRHGAPQEEELFAEFNKLGNFLDLYGDILTADACERYAAMLKVGAGRLDVRFADATPALARAAEPNDWIFVDRIHFTDFGHELMSKSLLELLS